MIDHKIEYPISLHGLISVTGDCEAYNFRDINKNILNFRINKVALVRSKYQPFPPEVTASLVGDKVACSLGEDYHVVVRTTPVVQEFIGCVDGTDIDREFTTIRHIGTVTKGHSAFEKFIVTHDWVTTEVYCPSYLMAQSLINGGDFMLGCIRANLSHHDIIQKISQIIDSPDTGPWRKVADFDYARLVVLGMGKISVTLTSVFDGPDGPYSNAFVLSGDVTLSDLVTAMMRSDFRK